jgi:hypothetical protein
MWPLDALFGAGGDVVELEEQPVRDTPAVHYRLKVDLASADALVPARIRVPEGPYRLLRRLPTEVWLDSSGLARRIAVEYPQRPVPARGRRWTVTESGISASP